MEWLFTEAENPRQTLKTNAAASSPLKEPLKETDHKNWSVFSRHFKMYTVKKGQEIWLKSPNIIDKQFKYSADGM